LINKNVENGIELSSLGELEKSPLVKSVDYYKTVTGYSDSFKAVGLADKGIKTDDITIEAVNDLTHLGDFKNNDKRIVSGNALNSSNKNKQNAVISSQLAELNKIKVGDKIVVGMLKDGKTLTLNVSGIFDANLRDDKNKGVENDANLVYVNYATLLNFLGLSNVDTVIFNIRDPKDNNKFVELFNSKFPSKFNVTSVDGKYRSVSSALDSTSKVSNLFLFISLIASALILILVVLLLFRKRYYEIGILLSCGEKKSRIVLQMAVEILIPVLIAFSISAILSNSTVQVISNIIYNAQVSSSGDSNLDTFVDVADDNRIYLDADTLESYESQSNDVTQTQNTMSPEDVTLQVNITPNQYLLFFGFGILIVLSTTVIMIFMVLTLSPRKILLRQEG
jgi:putative ABC transport system permease protein